MSDKDKIIDAGKELSGTIIAFITGGLELDNEEDVKKAWKSVMRWKKAIGVTIIENPPKQHTPEEWLDDVQ